MLSVEPPHAPTPLFQARNCILTPHIACATKEALSRVLDAALENLEAHDASVVSVYVKDRP